MELPTMQSPFARLYLLIMQRLKNEVAELRYINQDLEQLEKYDQKAGRPAVTFPCCLIDFDDFQCNDLAELIQHLEGNVIIRIALDTWSSASNISPAATKKNALTYYDIEHKVYKALHGWSPGDEYGTLTRIATSTEKREDAIRVRRVPFRLAFDDYSAERQYGTATVQPVITAG